MVEAVFTNIQRYSIHDGPGLRTILFLKGCPLSCRWCSNPETQNPRPELFYSPTQCIACGNCVTACKYGAFTLNRDSGGKGMISLDKSKCIDCGDCADVCPTGAASMTGKVITVEEAADVLEADAVFFRRSGGGVTISGGEPTQYPAFVNNLIIELKKRGIHSAVETCGYAAWETLWETVQNADLVLFDLKAADPAKHKEAAGMDNDLILGNAKKLAGRIQVIYRIPVIPRYTAETENLEKLGDFVAAINKQAGGWSGGNGNSMTSPEVHLLPYHSFGSSKYRGIGKIYELGGVIPPTDAEMESYKQIFLNRGVEARIV